MKHLSDRDFEVLACPMAVFALLLQFTKCQINI